MCFKRSLLKYSIFVIIIFIIASFFIFNYQKKEISQPKNNLSQPQELINQPQKSEVHSSDGIMTLIMQIKQQNDQSQIYSFFVANITGKDKNERLLFTKTIGPKGEMFILLNSWSPDNKHLYLKEKSENGQLNFLVLKASGESFTNGKQYLDIGAILKQKKTESFLYDITGWVSPIFLNVITTDENATKKGPSYWFNVNSGTFL